MTMKPIKTSQNVSCEAFVETNKGLHSGMKTHGHWDVECIGADGQLKWVDEIDNIVVNQGLDHALSSVFGGSGISTWYIGLTDASPTGAAGDIITSHAGWNENTTYSEGNRQTWVHGVPSAQSISNSANKAAFSINGTTSVGGAFLISDNTKGGTVGNKVLYSVGAFTGGNRSLQSGDTLNVQATFTQADDGV